MHLFQCRDAAQHFVSRALFQRLHAVGDSDFSQMVTAFVAQDGVTDLTLDGHGFEDTGPPSVARLETRVATFTSENFNRRRAAGLDSQKLDSSGFRLIRSFALGANLADQSLRDDALQTIPDEHRRNIKFAKDVDDRRGIVCVQGA